MLILSFVLQGLSLGLSAAAAPGSFQTYLISQSLRLGWRRALPVAFAPLISDGPILAVVLFALTRLPADFLRWLQIIGSVYVLFLAWKSFQAYRAYQPGEPVETHQRQSLLQAAFVNLLNPNPYIFWSILAGPLFIAGWKANPLNGLAFLLSFYGVMIGGLALLVVLFGSAGRMGPRVNRALLGLSALALVCFGIYQLWQGIFIGPSMM